MIQRGMQVGEVIGIGGGVQPPGFDPFGKGMCSHQNLSCRSYFDCSIPRILFLSTGKI
jgi:hypothetical protein